MVIGSDNGLIPVANNIICTVPSKYKPSTQRDLGIAFVCPYSESGYNVKIESVRIDASGNILMGNWIYGNRAIKAFAIHSSYYI